MTLHTYLPQDRFYALAHDEPLPDRAFGTVLFADISGFTPFTEALHQSLGPRRGAEELSHWLDAVYTALIAVVERYGGSVVGFAGDAITCWFKQKDQASGVNDAKPPSALRAVACAVAMQEAMQAFQSISLPQNQVGALALKVAIATGPVRRFVVGDVNQYQLDVLVGRTVNRTGTGERLAVAPEIILDEATVRAVGEGLTIVEWRVDQETGARFGVIGRFAIPVFTPPPGPSPLPILDDARLYPWLDPQLYHWQQAGHAVLLTQFRPCAALFVCFGGIIYDSDAAAHQLDQFIRRMQAICVRYEGTLIDLTFGDKGSYAYISFGALNVHEDDARRAVKTALELRDVGQTLAYLQPLQIGITYGIMRVGAYGGPSRRYYGAVGDEVNLAARLMTAAAPGEILVSGRIYDQIANDFSFSIRRHLTLKGKREPISVFVLRDTQPYRTLPLLEPTYTLPLVGRTAELEAITATLSLVQQGRGQIIELTGEAGMGKSRLMAEVVRLAQAQGFTLYGGACQSDGQDTPYLVWKPIWSDFFGATQASSADIEAQISRYASGRVQALPLLNILLNRTLPENSFTQSLAPEQRQSALHALLEACLQGASQAGPLLLALDDLHWLDALSHTLLVQLARVVAAYPICFLLTQRQPRTVLDLETLPYYHKIELGEMAVTEVAQVVEAKLRQLYPTRTSAIDTAVSPLLVEKLRERAQGNPFYLEELLNYLHDQRLDPWDTAVLAQLELPDSLHALILSRIDQLHANEKAIIRVASIIGRLFYTRWLTEYYPEIGDIEQVQVDLGRLTAVDLISLDATETESSYLFKHIITHEVTYESLPFATRAYLHEQLAHYLEKIEAPLESIAHHYGRSKNRTKQIEYFRKAGAAAQAAFANQAALDYFDQLLPLLADDPLSQMALQVERGNILIHIGEYSQAEQAFAAALSLAEEWGDALAVAECYYHMGRILNMQGAHPQALDWLGQAETAFKGLDAPLWLARTYEQLGNINTRQGQHAEAELFLNCALEIVESLGEKRLKARLLSVGGTLSFFQGDYEASLAKEGQALALLQALDDKQGIANVLGNLGVGYSIQGFPQKARRFYEESLELAQAIGDKQRVISGLANLGLLAHEAGDLAEARMFQEQGLALVRQVGNKYGECIMLINLGNLAVEQGDGPAARAAYVASVALSQEINDQNNLFYSLSGVGATAVLENDLPRAVRLAAAAEMLRQRIGTVWDKIEGRIYERTLAAARAGLDTAVFEAAWAEGSQWLVPEAAAYAMAETNSLTPSG